MTLFTKTGREIYAPTDAAGHPRGPSMGDAMVWSTEVERLLSMFLANGGLIYDTKAHLDADLAHDANSSAWVVADSAPANNGIYRKVGASGSGSWSRVADLPYSIVHASNAGAGTADAVQATTTVPVSTTAYAQLISLPFVAANSAAMTVSINGETARNLVTNTGDPVPAGYIRADMAALVMLDGDGAYRLFSYGDAAAIQAAAEAALAELREIYLQTYADDTAATAAAGGAPVEGQLYWNSTVKEMRVWDGSAWIVFSGGVPDGSVTTPKIAAAAVDDSKIDPTAKLHNRIADMVSVKDYGAKGDGVTDDTSSIQAAIDAVEAAGGGIVFFPRGTYVVSATLTVEAIGVTLQGVGCGDMVTPAGAGPDGPTTIRCEHTAGAGVWIKTWNCAVRDMRIDSGTSRAAAAFAIGNAGLRIEATDTGVGVERVMMTRVEDVHVVGHPGDGIVLVGECAGSVMAMCGAAGNKGHGIVIDGGQRYSRANLARPGIADLLSCRSQRNGGHALVIGSPSVDSDLAALPYRIYVHNFECFGNADDGAVRYSDDAVWAYGENLLFELCAFGGISASGTLDAHRGLYITGQHIRLTNNRFVSVSRAATVGQRTGLVTYDVVFDGMYFSNGGGTVMDPAIVITEGAQAIKAHAAPSSFVTNLVTTSVSKAVETEIAGNYHGYKNRHQAGGYLSLNTFSLADDAAIAVDFELFTSASGIAIIACNTLYSAMVFFRVGSSPECTIVTGHATFAATTGTLGGATGTDGKITVAAHTDGKLRIENRSGATRNFSVTFLSLNDSARVLSI